MANPITGRTPKAGSEGRILSEHAKAIAQLQRGMIRLPKPEKATAGVWGSTLVYPGTPSITASGGVGTCLWTDAGWSSEPVGGTAPPVSWGSDGILRVTEAGVYTFTMRGKFWWDITADMWAVFTFGSDLAPIYSADQGFTPYLGAGGTRRELQICHQFGGARELPASAEVYVSLLYGTASPVQIAASQPRLEVTRVA